MSESFPHTFAPIALGPAAAPNRLYVTPHFPGLSMPDPTAPGFFGPAPVARDYYVERARGGVGLIIQGGTFVSPESDYTNLWQMFSDGCVDAWAPIVDAVQSEGTTMFVQLLHAGHHGDKRGLNGGPKSASNVPPIDGTGIGAGYAPLPVPVKPMSKADIRAAVADFARCTRHARAAGYRGVELHASHSYLNEQFYSPFFNKRTDEYGGSLDNRLRFTWEVLEAMREAADGTIAVGVRLICDEMLPGGLGRTEMTEIAQRLDESGLVDFLDLDVGTYHSFDVMIAPWELADSWEVEHIRPIAQAIRYVPRLWCPGRFHDPALAEDLIASGDADMVGGTRGFFADPEIARKAKDGRAEDIRPCIGLNTCMTIGACVVNPDHLALSVATSVVRPAEKPKRVLVAGGGPAGLEAARVAAIRGHRVVLYEAADQLGGAVRLMQAMPGREHVGSAVDWWARQLDDLGVKVHLGTPVATDVIDAESPDAVIVATGATFDRTGSTAFVSDPIPGFDRDFVHTPEAVLGGDFAVDGTVIVLDEETTSPGHGVAEVLAQRGARVELVTRQLAVGLALAGGWQHSHVMRRLHELGITARPNTYVRAIGDHTVTLYDVNTGEEWTVPDVAGVVLVTGRSSRNELAPALAARVDDLHVIGDAFHPRTMADATRDGHRVGKELQ